MKCKILPHLSLVAMMIAGPFVTAAMAAENTINLALAADAKTPVVLIYYANESFENERARQNADEIVSRLRAKHSTWDKATEKIVNDREKLNRAVQDEIQEIRELVSAGTLPAAVIFTNAMATQDQFQVMTQSESTCSIESVRFPASEDYVYQSQKLSHPASLPLALEAVAKLFASDQHQFVLVTKSYGTSDKAMIPSLGLHAEETSEAEFLQRLTASLEDADPASEESLHAEVATLDAPGGGDPLDPPGGNDPLGVKGKLFVGGLGTSKETYTRSLADAHDQFGMKFALVFVESCRSGMSKENTRQIETCVGLLHMSGEKGLDYRTISYRALLDACDPQQLIGRISCSIEKAVAKR
jgi:hypothetical protein